MDQPFTSIRRSSGSTMTTNKTTKTKVGTWTAEFIGTFFWVLFVKLSGNSSITPLGGQYGVGFGLLVLIYQFGYKSGAQFNPCVCIGLLCRGSLDDFSIHDYQNIIMYLLAQISGGLLGGFFAWSITDDDQCQSLYFYPQHPFQPIQAMGAEFIFTFLLVFVIINVATSQQPNQFYGLSIGWTVFVAIGAIGNISGCSLNIAVYFGTIIPATACTDDINNIKWKYWWVYIVGDVVGAICAGFLYRFLFITKKLRKKKFQKLLTELIGTFLLVVIVKLALYSASIKEGNGGIIAVETIGIGLIILVYLFEYIGGAHFNPSVSFGVYITQQDFTTMDFLSYVGVQIVGGTLGGLFVYGIGGTRIGQQRITYNHDRFDTSQAFFAEVIFTFLLVNCVLNVATSAIKKNYFYGLAIGSCLGTAVCAVGINGLSGACLNFAVFFGSNVSALIAGVEWSDLKWIHLWIYFVAPLVGAGIAGVLYKYLYQDFDLESEVEYAGERNKHRLRRYVAEFIGTAYLVCIIKLVSASYPKDDTSSEFVPNISAAVGVGFGLIALIYQFGYISQAHFNPAITIGVWLHGDIEGFEFDDYCNIGMYIVMQLLGGFVGGLCAWSLGNDNAGNIYPHIHGEKEDYQVFGAEFIFTFLLVLLLIINVTLTKPKDPPNIGIPGTASGISVGWMVMAAIGAIGTLDAVNGCCLNPAVWFGCIMSAACSSNDISDIKFGYIWVYVLSEILAGIAAGLLVRYLWKDQERRETFVSKYVAEFFGTFFLVSFIKLSISNQETNKNLYDQPILSIGFGLVILTYCFGCISGAHFNPAISVGVYCRGFVDGFYPKQYKNLFCYIFAQLLGGLVGGMYSWGISGKNECRSVYPYVDTNKMFGSGTEKAFGAEWIFTFLLVSSVIHTGTEQQPNDFYGMSIGFTLFAASQLIAPISGACLNPAVWFGTIISAAMCINDEDKLKWDQLWIYIGAPLFGGIIAGFVYRLLYYEVDMPRAINEPVLGHGGGDDHVLTNRDIWAAGNSPKSDRL